MTTAPLRSPTSRTRVSLNGLRGLALPGLVALAGILTGPAEVGRGVAWAAPRGKKAAREPKVATAAPAAITSYEGVLLSCGKDIAVRSERGARAGEWRDCEAGATLVTADRVRTGKAGLVTISLTAAADPGARAAAAPAAEIGPAPAGSTPGEGAAAPAGDSRAAAAGRAKPSSNAAVANAGATGAAGAAPAAGAPAGDGGGNARVWLDPGSQLQLLPSTKKVPAGVALTEGAARFASEPLVAGRAPRPLRVQLPDGELRVRGVARVELGPGDTTVAVYDGQAELTEARGRRATVKVPAGAGALLRRGGKLRTGGLIGAPSWEGERGLYFALPQRGPAPAVAEVALPFRPVQGAVRYRVEVGKDEALLDRLQTTTLSAELRRAPVRLPGRGRYYVRLQAVDSDQVSGPGPVQVVEVVEVRGERVAVSALGASGGGGAAPLLQGTGELAFELLSGGGRLQVQLDGRAVANESQSPSYVQLRVGRGGHRVQVRNDAGYQGELRVQVTRPSYEVELSQGLYAATGRSYRIEVRALDGAGQRPPPVVGLSAHAGPVRNGALSEGDDRPVALVAKAPGIYQGELAVASGQVLRLAIADADGPLVTTDLRGSPE